MSASSEPGFDSSLSAQRRIGLVVAAIALGLLAQLAVRHWSPPARQAGAGLTSIANRAAAAPVPADERATDQAIRFYTARVKRDPEDTRSQNALAEFYLQRVRETGNEDYLPLAVGAAQASLAAVPAERNLGGLTALAHAEFANHNFAGAQEHARQLLRFQPAKSEPYAVIGDASLELGDYEEATTAYKRMQQLAEENAGTETRLARLAILHGATDEASRHFARALALLHAMPQPPNETIAWCEWQWGETAFSTGDYATAEQHYRAALEGAPGYFRALGSMGRLRAAQHDFAAAIARYEEAIRIAPVLDFMAALGDLYQLVGRKKDAAVRYELAEQLGEHSRKVHGTSYDRHLALFLADHDRQPEQAYNLARDEYAAGRHDVYGADALAWTALKAGYVAEAQTAMNDALRLGTRDAKFFYHAGLIASTAGDRAGAISFLESALALNPQFDPWQSANARQTLKETKR